MGINEGPMSALVIAAMAGVDRKDVSNLIRDHPATLREIGFIDRKVDDLETLLAGRRSPKKASLTAITTDSRTVRDFITNDNTLIFSGKEMRISALWIWISGGIYGTGNGGKGTLIGTVPTDSSPGNNSWSFNYAGTALADGTY